MVGPTRPQFVLFGSSIVQLSFSHGGWGALLSDIYSRKADIVLRGYYGWNSRLAIKVLDQVFPKVCLCRKEHALYADTTVLIRINTNLKLKYEFLCKNPHVVDLVDVEEYFRCIGTGFNYIVVLENKWVKIKLGEIAKDAAVQPSLIIVYFGGNDSMGPHSSGLGPHVPLPEYIENMRKIAVHLKNLSDTTRIVFLSCPPVDEARIRTNTCGIFSELVRTNELCQKYSEACIKLCQEMDLKVVDLFSALQKRSDWTTACFTDGVHLSAEGSKIVVEEILKVLNEAEWSPSLHWKSMHTEFSEDSPYYLVAADGKTTLNPSDWTFHREIEWD